jgi:hypothetical protein
VSAYEVIDMPGQDEEAPTQIFDDEARPEENQMKSGSENRMKEERQCQ